MQLSAIKVNPKNPRLIKDAKADKLMQSLLSFPQMLSLRPIVVDASNIALGGNMRLSTIKRIVNLTPDEFNAWIVNSDAAEDAAVVWQQVRETKKIPDKWILKAADLTEDQQREFTIKDNVSGGEWDWDMLANEWDVQELEDWGLDIPVFETNTETQEDEYDGALPEHPETVIGDLYEIGAHRLLCGDSTDSDQAARLMNGEKADMVFTDPPYEIDFSYENALLFSENAHVFIFNNDRAIVRQLSESPFVFKGFFVFNHSGTAIPQEGGHEVFLDHILISHEVNGSPSVRYNKGEGTRTVIRGEYRHSENHKHEKPNNLLSPIVKGYSNEWQIVLDFFIGGGSLMATCEQLNRKCYGMELDPKYCDVIVKRMIKLNPALTIKRNREDVTEFWKEKAAQ